MITISILSCEEYLNNKVKINVIEWCEKKAQRLLYDFYSGNE